MTDALDQAALEAARKAYLAAEENPNMVQCPKCNGRGYHHGFGENGADPDWCSGCGGGGYDLADGEQNRPLDEAIRAYLAARSVPEAGKAVVKPLEWHLSDDSERWVAVRPFGEYIIVRDHRASAETTHGWFNEGRWEWFGSFDAAKATAQADYEQRILSALASVPAPSGAEPTADQDLQEVADGAWGDGPMRRRAAFVEIERRATVGRAKAATPQTVPAEDVAGQAWQELVEKDDRTSPAEYPDMALITRGELEGFIGSALTILSTRLDWAESGQRTDNINSNRYFEKWQASEAEVTSLRRKLEELRQAYESARYAPGDHPVVPAKIDAFMKVAAHTLSGASE